MEGVGVRMVPSLVSGMVVVLVGGGAVVVVVVWFVVGGRRRAFTRRCRSFGLPEFMFHAFGADSAAEAPQLRGSYRSAHISG